MHVQSLEELLHAGGAKAFYPVLRQRIVERHMEDVGLLSRKSSAEDIVSNEEELQITLKRELCGVPHHAHISSFFLVAPREVRRATSMGVVGRTIRAKFDS